MILKHLVDVYFISKVIGLLEAHSQGKTDKELGDWLRVPYINSKIIMRWVSIFQDNLFCSVDSCLECRYTYITL